MPHKVIYLTGAPGTGKTSLAKALAGRLADVSIFNYGKAMLRRLQASETNSIEIDLLQLRENTYGLVNLTDVSAVDSELITWISKNRGEKHLIIDTHQIALGPDGLSCLSFSKDQLTLLAIDEIWVLAAPSGVLRSRLSADSQGRRLPSEFMADCHSNLQSSLAMSYALELRCYLRLFDASEPLENIVSSAIRSLSA